LLEILIKFFRDCGSHVVFLSSNAVFDGSKPFFKITDRTSPVTNYGKFKAEVEARFQNDPNIAILRLTKVITSSTPFVRRWIEQFDRSESITAYEDCYLSPINISDVISNIELLIKRRSSGIFQYGGVAEISYFDYAQTLFSNNPKAVLLNLGIMGNTDQSTTRLLLLGS
jgi:dTDP-4-dehydrorhamnose reductase